MNTINLKKKGGNTMFNVLESYGDNDPCFLEEGQSPAVSDSHYARKTGQQSIDKESETSEKN